MSGYDVIVIGAGASGLMAALQLAKAGKKVQVLEARARLGGRIYTTTDAGGNGQLELGAEFIHGNLPETQQLLKEAGLTYHEVAGEMWRMEKGALVKSEMFIPDWPLLVKQLELLQEDITLESFLQQYFPGERYSGLRKAVENYAAGYDNADASNASVFALRKEWLQEEDAPQYRIDKGYGSMIAFMAENITALGSQIIVNALVKEIHWQPGKVTVHTEEGSYYIANKIVIALPLGVLQANAKQEAAVAFMPVIDKLEQAFHQVGMGAVIKILIEFAPAFYQQLLQEKGLQHMQFLFSEELIDTWWTQVPQQQPVFTGWLGGFKAKKHLHASSETLLQMALQSLATILQTEVAVLQQHVTASKVANWTEDTFTLGSYSYATVETPAALPLIEQGLADTLYFAGEAFYQGSYTGTVEAALVSGKQAALKALQA
ncbi:flavin monoamine oxidase family protein [Filimonas lacunae]|nr:FAD-dependent oxidoreductase [Filimonas lacunae]